MKYAIISDIHGNLPAFKAVLADANEMKVDDYILLGDYAICLPWGNEVVNIIKELEPAYIIRGNQEDYLINLHNHGKLEENLEQIKPVNFAYNSLSPENFAYLISLPSETGVKKNDVIIHMAHRSKIFYRSPQINLFHCYDYRKLYEENPLTTDEYMKIGREIILSHPEALDEIESLSEGIYLFADNHIQFHMEYKGRFFINPGSAGIPLDGNNDLSYTILEITDGGINIENRRVKYDYEGMIKMLSETEYSHYSPLWSRIIEQEVRTGWEHIAPFLLHLHEIGDENGEMEFPVSNRIWDLAVRTWDFDNKY